MKSPYIQIRNKTKHIQVKQVLKYRNNFYKILWYK